MEKSAQFSSQQSDNIVECQLCPANCILKDGQRGICKSRFNSNGELLTDNYGEAVTIAIDPIEKKPLYHFYPGSDILSTGPNCCNLGCLHCQNWQISQEKSPTIYLAPDKLVETTLEHDVIGVAFTYTEPLMWFEYILDCAPLFKKHNLKIVMISNGFINREPLQELLPVIDAWNIDLKSMNSDFYKKICKGRLEPVLDTTSMIAESGSHLEITNLIIPGENDSDEELNRCIEFVSSLDNTIPLHFSAYRPEYKMKNRSTPDKILLDAFELAKNKLKYVYLGNTPLSYGKNTDCPECGALLIERKYFNTQVIGVTDSKCTACGYRVEIIGI